MAHSCSGEPRPPHSTGCPLPPAPRLSGAAPVGVAAQMQGGRAPLPWRRGSPVLLPLPPVSTWGPSAAGLHESARGAESTPTQPPVLQAGAAAAGRGTAYLGGRPVGMALLPVSSSDLPLDYTSTTAESSTATRVSSATEYLPSHPLHNFDALESERRDYKSGFTSGLLLGSACCMCLCGLGAACCFFGQRDQSASALRRKAGRCLGAAAVQAATATALALWAAQLGYCEGCVGGERCSLGSWPCMHSRDPSSVVIGLWVVAAVLAAVYAASATVFLLGYHEVRSQLAAGCAERRSPKSAPRATAAGESAPSAAAVTP
eukprot:TRINITY_DN28140_c0_g1_i1.p1 TRINITY_DN28140_c0_g1~~TRINITY_DN28140_c0_g1_i1.p1  ORF type:complete len:360 (+),score=45.54 TRINITY_DN28140_c0_g1_i1:129-1082(+)